MVKITTSMGDITLELYPEKAPDTVANFLEYVDSGFYSGKIFHRVIRGFMIQGGGMDADMNEATTRAPIKNEAATGIKNERGTVAMARTMIPDSATAQFFINTVDNGFLDFKDSSTQGIGYCAFGRVAEGLDVIDKIQEADTGNVGGHGDVPLSPITILEATRVDA